MLAKRIIPCLDVRDGMVVKGVKFSNHRVAGEIAPLARKYAQEGADEIVLYDITASVEKRRVNSWWVREVAQHLDIPFSVAGGISNISDAGQILENGADKISINTPALLNPKLIDELAREFGSQCIVLGVDSWLDGADKRYHVYSHTGDENSSRRTNRYTLEWVTEAVNRGVGEVVINVMNRDGVRSGYDVAHLREVTQRVAVPVVASGGAGEIRHFERVFKDADVSAALAASIFHSGELIVNDLKKELASAGICVRL